MQVELSEIPSPGALKGEAIVYYCDPLITRQCQSILGTSIGILDIGDVHWNIGCQLIMIKL
jgi:hypothetical protein